MVELIVICVIAVSIIVALFLAWYFFQQARNRERMALIKKGKKWEEFFQTEKKNNKFIFPWLKMGIVAVGMSVPFLIIGFVELRFDNAREFLNEFIITALFGICLGIALFINQLIGNRGG